MSDSNNGSGGHKPPQANTSDFIGFSIDTQGSPNKRFTPANYSSPQGYQHIQQPFYQNNRQWGNRKFNNYNNQNNRSSYGNYNSPNRSFNRSHNSSHNQSFNRSHNNSHNQGQNRSFGHFKAKQDHNNTFNKQLFMHPSFLEDPWAQLEQQLAQKRSLNANNSEKEETTT